MRSVYLSPKQTRLSGYFTFLCLLLASVAIGAVGQSMNPGDVPFVERVEVDRTELTIPCDPKLFALRDHPCATETSRVKVNTFVTNPRNQPIIFVYVVTAGRIIGQGATVYWDLTGVRRGTYEVSAAIDFGRGPSSPVSAEKVVISDDYCTLPPCICPSVEILSPLSFDTEKDYEIEAIFRGCEPETTGYGFDWKIEAGKITGGQGTSKISVRWIKPGATKIRVEISGTPLCDVCLREFSRVVEVSPPS